MTTDGTTPADQDRNALVCFRKEPSVKDKITKQREANQRQRVYDLRVEQEVQRFAHKDVKPKDLIAYLTLTYSPTQCQRILRQLSDLCPTLSDEKVKEVRQLFKENASASN